MAHEAQDFLNPFYFKKIICEDEFYSFTNALKNYRTNLQSNANQNEDSLVANALKPFFEALLFQAEAKHKQKGNSEIDLALKKDSAVSVIIEAKKPESKEIPSAENPNAKALHEAILYYFREREMGNLGIKSIVLTDFYRFFIIKSRAFESVFYENPAFKKLYENFTAPNSLFKGNTDEFYRESKRILDLSEIELNYFCIDLARIFDENDFSFPSIKPIFKVLNREFLLDEFSPNDANVLNERFYRELLYIMGLDEFKEGKNILIKPSKESKIEQNTLYKCILDKLPSENRNFDFAMQFVILWLNRILFLKLVEANLVRFNADKNLKFLHLSKVIDFKTLSNLFFEILAKMPDERKDSPLSFLPYLNSSLFERHKCEETLDISALDDNAKLAYFNETQLKDKFAKKKQGDVGLLAYIFEFLDAFDFGSDEGSGELATQKELISSSVLGLVFEKLNGYKEGSFFTPSFITGYMCKESLEKVVVQKFGDLGLNAPNLAVLKSQILININADFGFRDKALKILKSIKICDPAVGSGHFLVSALCEMVRIYRELGLVEDTLNACEIAVHNDEVHISKDSKVFTYQKPRANNENHKIQKSLFNLKKSIIENNLFGVDINPNSVEICKLRLWIELLKNSYYLVDLDDGFNANLSDKIHQMQTLPNIDINIKCGNSLISRFKLDDSLPTTQNIKNQISEYKKLVFDYKNADQNISTTKKSDIVAKIYAIKQTFRLTLKDPKTKRELENAIKKHTALYGLFMLDDESLLDGLDSGISNTFISANLSEAEQKDAVTSFANIKFLRHKLDSNGNGYKNAFEWRFEFPEVLDENGDFMGFDLMIGNPPYVLILKERLEYGRYKNTYKTANSSKINLYNLFFEKGLTLIGKDSFLSFVTPNTYLSSSHTQILRDMLLNETCIYDIVEYTEKQRVFKKAAQAVATIVLTNKKLPNHKVKLTTSKQGKQICLQNDLKKRNLLLYISPLIEKIEQQKARLKDYFDIFQGEVNLTTKKQFYSTKKGKNRLPMWRGDNVGKYYPQSQPKEWCDIKASNTHNTIRRIVIQQISNQGQPFRTKAFISDKNFICGNSTNYLIAKNNENLYFYLGLINSKAFNFYFNYFSFTNHITVGELERVPIPKITTKNKKIADKIINLVDKILESKAQGKETTPLESQIDDLVYKLYDLSKIEKAFVES